MSCYFRHMADIFSEAGITVTPENKKDVDRRVHELVGVEYKDCPAAWRGVKDMKARDGGLAELVSGLEASGL